jgi:hypothetical protein
MTEEEKRDELVRALENICSELGWVISVIAANDEHSTEESVPAEGIIIGNEEFVQNAEILLYEKSEVQTFAMEPNDEGVEGLIELSKEEKSKGKKLLH